MEMIQNKEARYNLLKLLQISSLNEAYVRIDGLTIRRQRIMFRAVKFTPTSLIQWLRRLGKLAATLIRNDWESDSCSSPDDSIRSATHLASSVDSASIDSTVSLDPTFVAFILRRFKGQISKSQLRTVFEIHPLRGLGLQIKL